MAVRRIAIMGLDVISHVILCVLKESATKLVIVSASLITMVTRVNTSAHNIARVATFTNKIPVLIASLAIMGRLVL